MLEDRNNLLELEGQLSNTESYSAPKLTSLPTTSSSAKIEMRNVKEIIFNHAKELHRLYQRGDDLSTEQLEAMSKGETVPENKTESKTNLYHDRTNVVGFKTDLRILVDFDEEEFDLVCGEGCLRDATDKKVGSDMSKLAREGKESICHMISESGIESDDDGQDKQEECTPKADVYGFIKTKTGWFSTVANAEFTTHPYHI
ncbi:hypothetical protein MFLAVUS_009051 [Mucor flavus]|uniref:Uncharacterized protein n=1 Tax=Mucor flavus TaxID=439312 RepID=A0ABP9Z8V6_9FUNG